MWGGHFDALPDDLMVEINQSITFDKALYKQDIAGSLAHVEMLSRQKIVTNDEAEQIKKGLKQVKQEIESGEFEFSKELEDIHMNIENRLRQIIGDVAGKLHTARSRNDQVATDIRLWQVEAINDLDTILQNLQAALIKQAEQNINVIAPGFTHLQTAQPIIFAHHLLAYVEMFGRDRERLKDCKKRTNLCPLGSAALAGTSYPIDRELTAKKLGFDGPTHNSLDSTADRDFAIEFLNAIAIVSMHLSRLSEELIIWCSAQFKFVKLSDKFTTGSSIMPQKRNPDAAELVRGKTGRIYGNLMALLTIMKGQPLTYNKDNQEDKEPLFDSYTNIKHCLLVMQGMIADIQTNKDYLHKAAENGYSTATDIADWLVQNLAIPFRDAHHITGQLVKLAEAKSCKLHELEITEAQSVEPRIKQELLDNLSVENSVKSRNSYGGTAPSQIKFQIKQAKERFL